MLTSQQAVIRDARPSYRPYRVAVRRMQKLSPHFVRVTLGGAELTTFGTDGLDQRVKLVFPIETGPAAGDLSNIGADDPEVIAAGTWYSIWRGLPGELRSPFRTYTVRAVRPELAEVDIDMVCHAEGGGPASRWLTRATIDDEIILVGPDAQSIDSGVGIDWHPGKATEHLLIGDETAVPAICSILETLPQGRRARAFVEIPEHDDALPLQLRDGVDITWIPRGDSPHGQRLTEAVRGWVATNADIVRPALASTAQQVREIDVDSEMLWESPATADSGFYGWLAGESSAIKSLRRFLVSEIGIDRKRIAFMGYWRLGKAELQ
ncbi:siderophore-interacting protein [Salinibacterium hongtaonis]|uniref:siderophore-interacting protein n=1 Tax=Homoserinimonas hongtaonis TaxID=2079791 RepID=UPI000D3B3919|nr:siderophore-interacting protein [Salinibacterium hongtaonis]AWB89645.1 siderophore-interacting protein [Salinibacterium hongtaonis]